MTFQDAVALLPAWVQYWLMWLTFGSLILPLSLFFWKQTRLVPIVTIIAIGLSAFAVSWLFDQMGYTKLIGLPHIIFWAPLCYYLYTQIKRTDMPAIPRRIMIIVLATLMISLAFDITDSIRYLLGERAVLGKA